MYFICVFYLYIVYYIHILCPITQLYSSYFYTSILINLGTLRGNESEFINRSAARGEGDMEEELPNFPSSASLDSSTSVGR